MYSRIWFARMCKTVTHELGHCLGLDHCVYYACGMQGSASLREDMRQPPEVCPICLRKVIRGILGEERKKRNNKNNKRRIKGVENVAIGAEKNMGRGNVSDDGSLRVKEEEKLVLRRYRELLRVCKEFSGVDIDADAVSATEVGGGGGQGGARGAEVSVKNTTFLPGTQMFVGLMEWLKVRISTGDD
jgi:hypothetical protein